MINRWDHIASSVDDRTREERGEAPLSGKGGNLVLIGTNFLCNFVYSERPIQIIFH